MSFDLGKITSSDQFVVEVSLDHFVNEGYLSFTDDKAVATHNRNSAISLLDTFKRKDSNVSIEHMRVLFIALVLLQEEYRQGNIESHPGISSINFETTFNKLIPKLETLVNSAL